ncbi:protein kinase [Nonomuraea sp. NPDC049607]|uniref:serine/threonine-protein kinase n=1 Tax=Nonomuraea sp. NPDC049607 TaxID=3154732 RepID=UPI003447643D
MPEQQTRLLAERYELIAPLGRGTMGTVWRARDRALGREVAVKEIRQDPGLTEDQRAELRERMVREGRIASRINHPSVAAIHDVLIQDDSPWIIMELIEARSLEQVIEEEGPLPPRLVAEIGVDLLGALRAAHSQGITHRDVKPGNVLITESGRVVLTDFGIAKAEGDSRLTKTGMVIGSPGYTAPERARGEYTGPESDIWSLGATLYFAVEGRPAYERATIAETLAALLSESADPPTQAGQLRPVLNGLLNKDYRQRLGAAKAETLMRMVADTPTSEMPALTAEDLIAQEAALPDPFTGSGPRRPSGPPAGASGPQGRPSGAPGAYGQGATPGAPTSGPQQAHPVGARPSQGARPAQPPQTGDEEDFDPERTVSVMRPKAPFSPGPEQGGGRPPQRPDDEGTVTTRRISAPPGAPGQQVYPPTQQPPRPMPQQGPGQGGPQQSGPQQGRPGQSGPGQGGQGQGGQGQGRPGQPVPHQSGPHQGQGLGTDLFAIAGQPEKPPAGNRNGMLVLMAVAAAAAVVIAVLIVALISS